MSQYATERRLAWFYSLLFLLLLTCTAAFAIVFNHWNTTLDVCLGSRVENTNCGCILYGMDTFTFFTGSRNVNCHYITYAPIPMIVYALVMAAFHIYRVCISDKGKYEKDTQTIQQTEGEIMVMTARTRVVADNDPVIHCWIPTAVIASVFALYNLIHAAILTDGYLKTCNQYRGYIIKTTRATGNQVTAIHYRLNCQAIFDFMDYIHPDVLSSRRGEFINTGLALQIALFCTWIGVILWILVAVHTSLRAHKEREVLGCCGR